MNFNLEDRQSEIDESKRILGVAGFRLTGEVALISDTTSGLPGVYRVWFQTHYGRGDQWMWVDDSGQVHYQLVNPMSVP